MTWIRRLLDGWTACIIAIVLWGAAIWYAGSAATAASRDIRSLARQADSLNSLAEGAVRTIDNRAQYQRLQARLGELRTLMKDSHKQGLVAPQLSEAARRLNLSVIEIQPVMRQQAGQPAPLPVYRVLVQGEFRDIAAYMQGCGEHRIPTRVISFDVRPAKGSENSQSHVLRASITIEAFLDGVTGEGEVST